MSRAFWRQGRASVSCHRSQEESGAHDENAVWATDDALALSFTRRYAEDWRYCAQWGKWLVWTGNRWQADDTLLVTHLMRHICREAAIKADSHRLAAKLASRAARWAASSDLARSDRQHAATSDEWDRDPWLAQYAGRRHRPAQRPGTRRMTVPTG